MEDEMYCPCLPDLLCELPQVHIYVIIPHNKEYIYHTQLNVLLLAALMRMVHKLCEALAFYITIWNTRTITSPIMMFEKASKSVSI